LFGYALRAANFHPVDLFVKLAAPNRSLNE
jgi:hypothetical protein